MRSMIGLAAAAMLATAAAPAMAQETGADDRMRISAAITAGTLGIGPEVGLRINDHFGVRANAGWLAVSGDVEPDDVSYNGRLNLESYGVMLDLHPFGGSFRVSAGARINKNRGRVDATPSDDVTIGDEDFTPAQVGTLRGRAEVKDLAPAVTIGWGGSRRKGFFFGADIGVLFQGSVRIRNFTSTGTLAGDPDFQAALERERADLQDDVDDYKIYPILQTSIGWRF